jgi:hypothetical protein
VTVSGARKLSKEESRQRFRELRDLWNEYDPIGCMTVNGPFDEYEEYVGSTMRLLERGASEVEIAAYIKGEVTGHMGMTWSEHHEQVTAPFAIRCRDWFEKKWHGTVA